MQDIEAKLLDELNKNSACFLGITNGSRLFARYDSDKNIKEILVLIDSYDIWAHVFYYDGYWYTTLVIFSASLNAKDIDDLFKNFWFRMDLANKDVNSIFWFPADDSHDSYQAIYKNTSFSDAVKDLIFIISNYEEWHNDLDTGECNNYWQVKQIYADATSSFV